MLRYRRQREGVRAQGFVGHISGDVHGAAQLAVDLNRKRNLGTRCERIGVLRPCGLNHKTLLSQCFPCLVREMRSKGADKFDQGDDILTCRSTSADLIDIPERDRRVAPRCYRIVGEYHLSQMWRCGAARD